jgi:hypothetical protein
VNGTTSGSKSAGSDSGSASGGSGGIIQSVKQVIVGSAGAQKPQSSPTAKVKDGSAHVHGSGSDAQVRKLFLFIVNFFLNFYLDFFSFSIIIRLQRDAETMLHAHLWQKLWICLDIVQTPLFQKQINEKRWVFFK